MAINMHKLVFVTLVMLVFMPVVTVQGFIWSDIPTIPGFHSTCDQCYSRMCACHHLCLFPECFQYGIDCHGHQDGGWSLWANWTGCTGTCFLGSRTRTRHCSNPEPKNCGSWCTGEGKQVDHTCTPDSCPQHNHHEQITIATAMTTKTSETTDRITPAPTTKTTPPTTTTPTTQTPTTSVTTALNTVFTSCSKLCTVSAVVNEQAVVQPNTQICSGQYTGSSEALPLHCCGNLEHRLTQQGINVMANCGTFPHYTAVASFQGGSVETGTEGVFVGCLPAPEVGFQLIRQDCNTLPTLVHVNTTQVVYGSPYGYFALV